ncbi:ATP-binding protein [Amphritea opalescens]|uniref:ATP-binding protein n=1 Tax=Amphritea opalescens TaxID=2490544 RepID=A0A430KS01_9GAMM|nr:ATP-binding protein [Amphritea opalescens]RTE66113.1 ATP-binding protein [Amphritea opalescens]
MTKATYSPHPNATYRGNPFIESLGAPLTQSQFLKLGNVPFDNELDLSQVPCEHHSYYVRTAIDNLSNTYVIQDEAYRVYDTVRRMMESGYAKRNPLSRDIRQLLMAVEKDKTLGSGSSYIEALDLVDTKNCFFIAGLSGRGKTTMIKHILKLIDQHIEHSHYVTPSNEEVQLHQTQITYLYVEVHERRGQKAVLMNLLEAIDAATGENYQYTLRNHNVNSLIRAVRKAVIIHGVGMIFMDEAQNLSTTAKSNTIGNNERTSMKFIEEIFNRISVPLCFIGTFSMLDIFSKEMTISRRVTTSGSLLMVSCDEKGSFWKRFIKRLCQTSLLKNQQTDEDTLRRHIHYISGGIPAIATSMVKATMSYLTLLDDKNQDLSIKALNKISDEQFKILKSSISALREQKYYKFEDTAPMIMLEHADAQERREAVASKVDGQASALMQDPVKVKDEPINSVDATKNSIVMDEMTPDSFVSDLGHCISKKDSDE